MKVSKAKIANHFGVTRQSVQQWFEKKVPAERVIELEKFTGVPRYELRPDIYPPEEYKQAS